VAQLAEDLRRHLEGEPVLARDATWTYVARRFAARHRTVLGLAAALVITAVLFGTVSTYFWLEAEGSREQTEVALTTAEQQREAKEGAVEFLRDLLYEAAPAGEEEAYERSMLILLTRAEETLDEEEPLTQAELLRAIGQVYQEWGQLDRANNVWARAADIVRVDLPNETETLAKFLNNRAALDYRLGDYAAAVEGYREALAIKRAAPTEEKGRYDIPKSLNNLANAMRKNGEIEGLESIFIEALELRMAEDPPNDLSIARSLRSLGVHYHDQG